MATLSIRPRRTKDNRSPQAVGPIARWRRGENHIALRADGSVVRRIANGTWTVMTLKGKAKKGLTVDEGPRAGRRRRVYAGALETQ